MEKKIIVVSAVNLIVGGTLTVLHDCLSCLSEIASDKNYRVVAIVHTKSLAFYPNIEYIEIPWAKKSWFARMWCEYVTLKKISKNISNVFLWLSLHDTSPNVEAKRRAVYCHNSFPFYKWSLFDLRFNYKVVLFSLLSKFAYRINIKRNNYVIVQQDWLKKEFLKIFDLNESKMIVAYPKASDKFYIEGVDYESDGYVFFYPSSASTHKNFHLVCEAASKIPENINFKVYLTINPLGNRYERWLYKKYSKFNRIKFVGFLCKEEMIEMYTKADCLIFASKIETWGLPISEFSPLGKPMLLADLPYARTSSQGSHLTSFFNADNEVELRDKMIRLSSGDSDFLSVVDFESKGKGITVDNWSSLLSQLLK
ncbi:glycosyltransferase [Sphingobacterium sp. MYb382]|uniref:glycosyltransferase n=1 Tax=Sphingobacterium sp. MYb382 TaxID=2745278 RepID=UPI0030A03695